MEQATKEAHLKFMSDWDRRGDGFDQLKSAIRSSLDKVRVKDIANTVEYDLITFAEHLIRDRTDSPEYTSGTVKTYKTTLNHLRNFARESRRKKLPFEKIDLDFSFDFREWLYSEKLMATNSVHKQIKTVRVFMNAAIDAGLTTATGHRSNRFQISTVESDQIYLTVEQLAELFHVDLSHSARLDKARDLWLVGAFYWATVFGLFKTT